MLVLYLKNHPSLMANSDESKKITKNPEQNKKQTTGHRLKGLSDTAVQK